MRKPDLFVLLSVVIAAVLLTPAASFAYLSAIPVLTEKDVLKLSDEAVTNIYLDVLIELDAITLQHQSSGFSPKEYQQYKELLRYRYDLRNELQRRQLDIPKLYP